MNLLNSIVETLEVCSKLKIKTAERHQWQHAQSAFICSKLTMETLEQGVKYAQS